MVYFNNLYCPKIYIAYFSYYLYRQEEMRLKNFAEGFLRENNDRKRGNGCLN